MVLGVSTGLEPIFSPAYKRRWRSGSQGVWNEALVIDPLYKELYLRGRDVSHCVGAYDVTPEEHIKVQSVVQQFIDSAVSKTCNLPANFSPESLYDDLITYASDIKGFTFYRAGSRGNEPLEAIDVSTLDLDDLIKQGKTTYVAEGIDTCKDGMCEL
jgi:ribonucleoside-diphosphate reductase alpha chain